MTSDLHKSMMNARISDLPPTSAVFPEEDEEEEEEETDNLGALPTSDLKS